MRTNDAVLRDAVERPERKKVALRYEITFCDESVLYVSFLQFKILLSAFQQGHRTIAMTLGTDKRKVEFRHIKCMRISPEEISCGS